MRLSLTLLVCLVLLCAFAAGCNSTSTYPVSGKVVYADGTPAKELAGGTVEFEAVAEAVSAHGAIAEDGSFRLTTQSPEDGAVAGKHRVVIVPPLPRDMDRPGPPVIDPRFQQFDTSGLEIIVQPGENNVTLKVEKPSK